jgi:glutathione S-transferase
MGSGPFLGGGFGHFYAYAPMKIEYAIDRFAMEVKRQLDVLDKNLAKNEFMAGAEYSIADMAIWPWYGTLMQGKVYNDAATYLDTGIYTNLKRWTDQIAERPGGQARPHGQPRLWRAFRAAARTPRRQRFRVADPGQDRGAGLSDVPGFPDKSYNTPDE